MPEGPSIVILREQAAVFTGQTIERAQGSAKLDGAAFSTRLIRRRRGGRRVPVEKLRVFHPTAAVVLVRRWFAGAGRS